MVPAEKPDQPFFNAAKHARSRTFAALPSLWLFARADEPWLRPCPSPAYQDFFKSLGATIVLGLEANGAKTAYDAGPTRESLDHASSLQTWTNVALVSSVVLVAGGAVLVLWPDPDGEGQVRVGATPGGVVMAGKF